MHFCGGRDFRAQGRFEGSNMPTMFSDQKEAGVSESNGQRMGRMPAFREWRECTEGHCKDYL